MRPATPQSNRFTLQFAVLVFGCVAVVAGCAKKDTPAQEFKTARETLMRGEFDQASVLLTQFIQQHADHPLSGRANFLYAKSRLGAGDLGQAKLAFLKTIEKFPGTEESNKAKFKLAMVDFLQGDDASAKRQFESLAQSQDGPYTPEAHAWLQYLSDQEKVQPSP